MGLLTLLGDFANWSTVVGLPHIANAKDTKWRLFWLLIFLVLLGVFCYELYLMISTLFSYPSTVATEIHYEQQRFPVITICNQNPFKASVVNTNTTFANMSAMLATFQQGAAQKLDTSNPDIYGFSAVQQDDDMMDWYGTTWLSIMAAQMNPNDLQTAMYSFDDLIAECSFSGAACNSTDFTTFVDPIYGQCFSFNGDESMDFSTSRAGMKYGLKLIVTPKQILTSGQQDYLPTTWMAGARIYVGSVGDYPQLFGSGQDVAVGYQAVLSVTTSQINRAPPPCGQCNDNPGKTNYYPNYTYTMETCFDSCRQVNNQAKCGCSNPRYAKEATDNYCTTLSQVQCLLSFQGDQSNKASPNPNLSNTCGCTPSCSENSYDVTMSLAKFPAESYNVATGSPDTPSCNGTSFAGNQTLCRQWYQVNSLQLVVYFTDLKYEKYTEDCSYGIQELINDLGGHAGLWLGLSVISVVEIFGLIIILLCYLFSGGKFNLRPSQTEFTEDERIQDLDGVDKELDHVDKHHEDLRKKYNDK